MTDEDRDIYKEALILRELIQKSTNFNLRDFIHFFGGFLPDDFDS
ncbi:hypothetical protein [Chitinophaga caseinilytica]